MKICEKDLKDFFSKLYQLDVCNLFPYAFTCIASLENKWFKTPSTGLIH